MTNRPDYFDDYDMLGERFQAIVRQNVHVEVCEIEKHDELYYVAFVALYDGASWIDDCATYEEMCFKRFSTLDDAMDFALTQCKALSECDERDITMSDRREALREALRAL